MKLTYGVHRALQQYADRQAIASGTRQTSFRQLASRVSRLAAVLQDLGVQHEARVALLASNSDRYLEYYLATWWAGAVANPVNTRWSPAEIAYSLNDSGTELLIVDEGHCHLLPAIHGHITGAHLRVAFFDDGSCPPDLFDLEALLGSAAPISDADRQDGDLAVIFYTGGTTGAPKGVMLTHGNLWASAMSRYATVPAVPGAKAIHVAPFFHVAGAGRLISHYLAGGSALAVPAFRPPQVIEAIARHGISEIVLVPSMLQLLLSDSSFDSEKLSSLRRIFYGGSPIGEALLDSALQLLPKVELIQSYGMTETSPLITMNPHDNHVGEGRKTGRHRSAGRAVLGVDLRIVDSQGHVAAVGTSGEIVVRGANVMQGYWGLPEQTSHALRHGWLHTGDVGYLDADGYLFVQDRLKDMIITGGENVYSAEVENVILQHPAVESCAVIGLPDVVWGERVHAAIVVKPGHEASQEEIQAFCRQHIAGYKCPKTVSAVPLLPMSNVGKVLKASLREAHLRAESNRGPQERAS